MRTPRVLRRILSTRSKILLRGNVRSAFVPQNTPRDERPHRDRFFFIFFWFFFSIVLFVSSTEHAKDLHLSCYASSYDVLTYNIFLHLLFLLLASLSFFFLQCFPFFVSTAQQLGEIKGMIYVNVKLGLRMQHPAERFDPEVLVRLSSSDLETYSSLFLIIYTRFIYNTYI